MTLGAASVGAQQSVAEPPERRTATGDRLPPVYPEWLGDRTFQESHGVRFPYVMGSMANGIAAKMAFRREKSHGPGGNSIPACSVRAAWAKAAAVSAVISAPQPPP